MNSISPELEELARFTIETKWEDLPAPVVHETKRLLLDSIGCALAGITIDPGKMAIALARRLGGPPESSIIGVHDKVSCLSAVLANGQLINAADYDALPPGGHTPPYVIPPPLAVAEFTGAPGKELILATALGFEIATRFRYAFMTSLPLLRYVIAPSPGAGNMGYAYCNFGAAAGAGRILKLDHEKMAYALGTAGHLCQVLTFGAGGATLSGSRPMTKYGVPGWQNTGGLMAVLLAEMGYLGDSMSLNPERGFWKFCGYGEWHPERITEDLGKTWYFTLVNYKPYPCCRGTHHALECFLSIINQNNLMPEDIESVKVFGAKGFDAKKLSNVVDVQFGIPYIFAMAAHRVPIGIEWQDLDRLRAPNMLEFAKKVSCPDHPETDQDRHLNIVEVVAKGKTFTERKTWPEARGGAVEGLQMTDDELAEKFRHNASRILTRDKIERAIQVLLELETLENTSELMNLVTL
jgi:2-methylcitrate dehydratase PrpD